MAALGKIRSKGALLIGIIGLGLFSFIAEEAFRSCDSASADKHQQVGEVLGEKINVTEFQKLVDEYTEVIKMQQGQENLNEDQLNQVKDMVWNTYVQTKLIQNEAHKLGLTVTDAELQQVLAEGTNPMLQQTPFFNQQTGRFDVNALKKFLAEYKTQQTANPQMAKQYETVYKYWTFIEKTLRQQLLSQKYQGLFAHCFLSNKVEAKMAFDDQNNESQVQLAAFPYSTIDDNKITVTDADLKAKYDEKKSIFKQYVETRDIKYIDVQVKASAADRAALQKEFEGYRVELSAAADPSDLVRKSTSLVSYLGVPVKKEALPYDIAQRLDSMTVGATSSVIENKNDNTLNLVKLIAKRELPDSIQFRAIQVGGANAAEAATRADSILNAIKAGADFEVVAKKYGQTGEKTWMTTRQYQNAPSLDKDTKNYIENLNTMATGELKNLTLAQGNLVLQVVDRKAMTTKYVAAVVKKNITFTKDTYSAAYNKFSSFVSANLTADELLKNAAKSGYTVQERKDVTTAEHYLAGIHATRDAMRWLFEAKKGAVSSLYECGDNDHLLIVVLNNINPIGYRSLEDAQVKEYIKAEVIKDKKAEQLLAKAKAAKSVADAKAKGAVVAPVEQVTFAAPVFVAATGASEPALSGAIAATAKGKFSKQPVKGNAGVYVFQVTNKTQRPAKFDEKAEMQRLSQRQMQMAGNFMNELYIKANVVDNRYLFF
ncbi:peptidylprolyl isomerase [Leyella stercorea]|uniref:peptidylprolyl isomerase n=1 Tax=Leyella stercorea TaxID=363265 RepID=UPI0024319B1F|nr:peptidylprolyl isomerase [Leyella stercorea]